MPWASSDHVACGSYDQEITEATERETELLVVDRMICAPLFAPVEGLYRR
jgi:hypothetical protein